MSDMPLEIERKYLIRRPSEECLTSLPEADPTEITQTYLTSDGKEVRRVRKRGSAEKGWQYTCTQKKTIGFGKRIELEDEITESQYQALLQEADPNLHTIRKVRWTFRFEGQFFELDVYDFSEDTATLEIELGDIDTPVTLPDGIELMEDVTGKRGYSNYALAMHLAFPAADDGQQEGSE